MAIIDSLRKGAEIKQQYKKFAGRRVIFILALIPVIFLLIGVALSLGTADVSLGDAYSAIFHKFFPDHFEATWLAEVCVWKLRLPRILMGLLAGIGLGAAGCTMQGVLRNPLADPYMLGIASSAGFGASLAILFGTGAVTLAGWLEYYLLLFLIPTRLTALLLALSFDFLPHYPHQAHAKDEPFRCTSNRVGMEWLLTPVLLYQNYHLVHHLYPTVPFYRYLKVCKAKKHYHESQNPAIADTFSLGPRQKGALPF